MFTKPRAKQLFASYGSALPLALALSLTLLSACSKKEKASEEVNEQSANYHQSADIQTISPSMSYDIIRSYVGKVMSKQLTSLSFEYAGKVANVYVDNGDVITKGQLLAEFDTELLTIKRREIDSTIAQLNAQAELNQLNLTRINNLNTKGYSSKQALDELETEQKIIQADISRQHANIATIEYQISQAKLHAPFDAFINTRSVAEGENFTPNQTAFELIKQTHHEITVGVPVNVASRLTIGQQLDVALNKKTVKAQVLVIGKQVHDVSRTVELRLALKQQSLFYNGQLVQVKIKQKVEKPGFWLPLSALTDGVRGQWNVYQVTKTTNALFAISASTIKVEYSTVDAAYITGLPLIDNKIIMAGVHRYVPGQLVKRAIKQAKTVAESTIKVKSGQML
ncbi:MAG: efflux RND transporter periplasmic adaptor subunit [Cognaticolwellia sp.]